MFCYSQETLHISEAKEELGVINQKGELPLRPVRPAPPPPISVPPTQSKVTENAPRGVYI